MASPGINFRLDDELYRQVRALAKQENVGISELIRTVLRRNLLKLSTFDAGYREGRSAGFAAVLKAHGKLLAAVPSTPPR
jgi:hypothetical protein